MLNVAWTINSHGCADGVVGSRRWYLEVRKEGQRSMMKTRKHQRAIHCHIRKNKCCSLLGTGRKETGGSWRELSNFLLVLTLRCSDWEDEGSSQGEGPIIAQIHSFGKRDRTPALCTVLQLGVLWVGLHWPQCSPAAFTASCLGGCEVLSLLQGYPDLFALGISHSGVISKENASLPHSAPAARAGYFHQFINICTEKILDGWVLTYSFNWVLDGTQIVVMA